MIGRNILYRTVCLMLIMVCTVAVKAQSGDFLKIDWTGFVGNARIPRVVSSFKLGADYASARYGVKIEYPEYEKMSGAEVRTLKKLELNVSDTIRV